MINPTKYERWISGDETMTTETTYKNPPLAKGRRGVCPLCLKQFKVDKGGRMVRHGEIGFGPFRQGPCEGYGARPLETTDADAIALLLGESLVAWRVADKWEVDCINRTNERTLKELEEWQRQALRKEAHRRVGAVEGVEALKTKIVEVLGDARTNSGRSAASILIDRLTVVTDEKDAKIARLEKQLADQDWFCCDLRQRHR